MEVVNSESVVSSEQELKVQVYVNLCAALYEVQNLPGLKFALKVAENIKTLEERLAPLNTVLTPSNEFLAFAKRVHEEAGNDTEKIKALEEENKELVEARLAQMDLATELLQNTTHIQLRKIRVEELSKEITAAQIKALDLIIQS